MGLHLVLRHVSDRHRPARRADTQPRRGARARHPPQAHLPQGIQVLLPARDFKRRAQADHVRVRSMGAHRDPQQRDRHHVDPGRRRGLLALGRAAQRAGLTVADIQKMGAA